MATETRKRRNYTEVFNGMQWRKESLLALKGSRGRFTALVKGKLWLVTELRLTGRERQLLLRVRCLPPTAGLSAHVSTQRAGVLETRKVKRFIYDSLSLSLGRGRVARFLLV